MASNRKADIPTIGLLILCRILYKLSRQLIYPTAKTFAILLNEFPVDSLHIAMATRFSTTIALRNWVSLFIRAGETSRTNF